MLDLQNRGQTISTIARRPEGKLSIYAIRLSIHLPIYPSIYRAILSAPVPFQYRLSFPHPHVSIHPSIQEGRVLNGRSSSQRKNGGGMVMLVDEPVTVCVCVYIHG